MGDGDKAAHAICIPFPAQGHINPMFKLALLLHNKGFHITFVHTNYNHNRLLHSLGGATPGFRYAAIPDGLPESADFTRDITSLCLSTASNCLPHLNRLIDDLNRRDLPVTCVIADVNMSFALDAAERIGVPAAMLLTASAGAFMCNTHIRRLMEKGFVPLQDKSYLSNGYLETAIDWVPGMSGLRLKHFSSVIRTTEPTDQLLNYLITQFDRSSKAAAIICNTFDALEHNVLAALPPIYTVGPLHLATSHLSKQSSSLWREDPSCLHWLDSKPSNSVLYINFGSITVLSPRLLREIAWGLARSKASFVWVVRPDLVQGEGEGEDDYALPPDFWEEVEGRGIVSGWCPQEEVLNHPAVGGFFTHCGWNSILEGVSSGVPKLCWPFFADQRLNCKYACDDWGIGIELRDVERGQVGFLVDREKGVERDQVEFLVRELMDGEKGRKLRERVAEWREKAAVAAGGSSYFNLDRLVSQVLHPSD